MDSVLASAAVGVRGSTGVEDVSFKSISEDTSPVVKLARSTLYDALKSGARDIHLESLANGLAIKLPHRRRAEHGRHASTARSSPSR